MSGAWWLAVAMLAVAPIAALLARLSLRRSFAGIEAEAEAGRDLRREVAALAAEIAAVRRRVDAGHPAADG